MSHYDLGVVVNATNIEEAKFVAETNIDGYHGTVWDYYDIKEVIPATDSRFMPYIKNAVDRQRKHCESLYEQIGITIEDYLTDYLKGKPLSMSAYNFREFAKIISGTLSYDSHIYDAESGTTRITDEFLKSYENFSEDYFLVIIDLHW